MRGLRVLVIDNSISFQEVLAKELLHRLPAGSLVERASDPIDAQEKMIPFHPAIIVMNFAMGSITVDGSKFLTRLTMGHQGRPAIPVIVYGLMSANRKLALLRGAAAYLKKPGTEASSPLFYDQLVDHIQQIVATQNVNNAGVGPGAMVTKEIWTATLPKDKFPQPLSPADRVIHQAETEKNEYQPSTQHSSDKETYQPADISAPDAPIELIAIGSSTGGTEALSTILTRLRPPLPGIVIVQHIPPMFSRLLSERLDNECALTVKEAATGDIVQPDHVYIAPGEQHMRVACRELADGRGEGGGKKQGLALLRQHLHDAADVVDKAHVEHAVGLIEHKVAHAVEREQSLADEVEQAARRGDEDVYTPVELFHLRALVHATEDDARAQTGELRVVSHTLLDLYGQLARRRKDEGPGAALPCGRSGGELLDDGYGKGGRLTGARLGDAQQVAPVEGHRDGLLLDGRGIDVLLVMERLEYRLRDLEIFKCCHWKWGCDWCSHGSWLCRKQKDGRRQARPGIRRFRRYEINGVLLWD